MFNNKPMFSKKIGLLASTALVASLAFSGTASAQIDEIIVTATKRTQTLQETPVTVSVTTADVLDKAQILDIQDLQSVVPSLRVGQLQSSSNTNFRIRGFGNGANNAGIEPSVGVFIDGVYRSRSAAQIGDLPKLERIEVLSGPQSTLFGKNASAGVISIVTAKPSFTPQGYIEAGVGNYNQRVLRGYVTRGLSDTIAFSVGGSYNKRDGYAPSAVAGLGANNERNRFSVRGQLLIEPRDDISIRLIADHSQIDERCCGVTNVTNGPTAGAIMALGGQLADPTNPFAYINFQDRDSDNRVNDDGISLHVDVELDTFDFTSITSLRSNKSFSEYDADFTTAQLLNVPTDVDISTFTQEVRLTSSGDNMIDWMLGGYYFSEDITQISGLDVGPAFRPYIDILSGGGIAGIEAIFGQAPGTFFNAANDTVETFTQANEAYSAFATVDFNVNDRLKITGGLNFTRDNKAVTGSTVNNEVFSAIDLNNDLTVFGVNLPTALFGQNFTAATGLAPTPANIAFIETVAPGTSAAINAGVAQGIAGLQGLQFVPQFLGFGNSVEDGRSNDEQVTWTARMAYKVNDNFNVYASAATGFKSTSWNLSRDSRPFAADAAALGAAGLLQPNQTFGTRLAGPEDAMVFEAGVKARFDKGAFNLAVFDQTIKGFQSNTFIGTGFVLANAGQQGTFGVEFDATYYPVDALKLTFAGIYLDAKYDSFVNAPGPNGTIVDRSGQTVAGVPEFGFSTSATYSHDFGGGTTGYIRGDYQYESEVDIVEILGVKAKTSIFNGSLGVKLDNGFGVQVWGRNVFGQESFISAFPGVVQAGTINAYPTAPPTYGVLLRKEF
ncbi:MAG: TonB-dependent receptor [Robiginitomaculum sp.]|nr:MAG: TonB-dependent receptor [Robiginitomaculum sp.]